METEPLSTKLFPTGLKNVWNGPVWDVGALYRDVFGHINGHLRAYRDAGFPEKKGKGSGSPIRSGMTEGGRAHRLVPTAKEGKDEGEGKR